MNINQELSYTLRFTQEELNSLYLELDLIDDMGTLKGTLRDLYAAILTYQQ